MTSDRFRPRSTRRHPEIGLQRPGLAHDGFVKLGFERFAPTIEARDLGARIALLLGVPR